MGAMTFVWQGQIEVDVTGKVKTTSFIYWKNLSLNNITLMEGTSFLNKVNLANYLVHSYMARIQPRMGTKTEHM